MFLFPPPGLPELRRIPVPNRTAKPSAVQAPHIPFFPIQTYRFPARLRESVGPSLLRPSIFSPLFFSRPAHILVICSPWKHKLSFFFRSFFAAVASLWPPGGILSPTNMQVAWHFGFQSFPFFPLESFSIFSSPTSFSRVAFLAAHPHLIAYLCDSMLISAFPFNFPNWTPLSFLSLLFLSFSTFFDISFPKALAFRFFPEYPFLQPIHRTPGYDFFLRCV